MRLTSLTAENFRLLEQFEIEFASDVTVLVGANNAGKSNIVDALLLPKRAIESSSYWNALAERHGFERVVSRHQAESTISLGFRFSELSGAAEYLVQLGPLAQNTLRERLVVAEREPNQTQNSMSNTPVVAQGGWWEPISTFFRSIVHIDPFRRVAFETAVGAVTMVQATGSDLAQVLHYHYNNDREHFDAYEAIVRRVLPEIEIIETPITGGTQTTVRIRFVDGSEKYDLWQLSSGVKDILVLLAAIHFSGAGSLLLIEEPENHLHPAAQKALAAVIREAADEQAKQTILTTHSELFLEQFEPEQTFFIDRHEGRAAAVRLDAAEVFAVWERLGIERTRLLEALGRSRQVIVVIEGRDDVKAFEPIFEHYELAQSVLLARAGGGGWQSIIDGARQLQDALDRFRLNSTVFVLLDNDNEREAKLSCLSERGFDEGHSHVWEEKELESYLLIAPALAAISRRDQAEAERLIAEVGGSGKERLARVLAELGIRDVGTGTIVANAVRAGEAELPEEFRIVVGKLEALLR